MLSKLRESELYQAAVELNVLIDEVANNEKMYEPAASLDMLLHEGAALVNELARASNVDSDEWRYSMKTTRASVYICAAMLDVCRIREFLDPGQYERVSDVLDRLLKLTETTGKKRAA